MSQYLVKLVTGESFLAERGWREIVSDSDTPGYKFKNVLGKDAPAISPKDRLIIPGTSIAYLIKQG